jgi:hypothetical protein
MQIIQIFLYSYCEYSKNVVKLEINDLYFFSK